MIITYESFDLFCVFDEFWCWNAEFVSPRPAVKPVFIYIVYRSVVLQFYAKSALYWRITKSPQPLSLMIRFLFAVWRRGLFCHIVNELFFWSTNLSGHCDGRSYCIVIWLQAGAYLLFGKQSLFEFSDPDLSGTIFIGSVINSFYARIDFDFLCASVYYLRYCAQQSSIQLQ